jgi:hypothetical protein
MQLFRSLLKRETVCVGLIVAVGVLSAVAADAISDATRPPQGGGGQSALEEVLRRIVIPDSLRAEKNNSGLRSKDCVSGLIVGQVASRFGQEFYDWFCRNWKDVRGCRGYNITIQEKVYSRQSSVLAIFIDEKKVSAFQVQTQTDDVEQLGSQQMEFLRYCVRYPEAVESQLYEDAE